MSNAGEAKQSGEEIGERVTTKSLMVFARQANAFSSAAQTL